MRAEEGGKQLMNGHICDDVKRGSGKENLSRLFLNGNMRAEKGEEIMNRNICFNLKIGSGKENLSRS